MKNAYFPQLTLEQINAAITAIDTAMQEKREIYYKCENAGDLASAQRVYGQYIALKGAKIQLEHADFKHVD